MLLLLPFPKARYLRYMKMKSYVQPASFLHQSEFVRQHSSYKQPPDLTGLK